MIDETFWQFILDSWLTILIVVGVAVVYILVFRWLYRDAESRGKDGCLVAFFVGLFGWPAWLLWLVFRPKKVDPDA